MSYKVEPSSIEKFKNQYNYIKLNAFYTYIRIYNLKNEYLRTIDLV